MRWPLSALLLATAIVASAFGVFRCFWDPSHPNHQILLGTFILLICVAIVAALFGKSPLRGAFFGASLFGIAYLICVLKCGFGLETIYDSQWLAKNTTIGFALFGISFLASQLSIMVTWPSTTAEGSRTTEHQSHPLEPAIGPVSNEKSSPPAQ